MHPDQDNASATSLSAAGIFFCFLEKAKVVLLPGDTAADRDLSPDEQRYATCSGLIHRKDREKKVCLCLIHSDVSVLGNIKI